MWSGDLGNHQSRATCFSALWLGVGGGLGKGTVPLPVFWGFAWHLPHFQSLLLLPTCEQRPSSCCLGVESQSGCVCVCFKTMWALKQSFLKTWQFLPLPKPTLVFTACSYGDLSFQLFGTLGYLFWSGAGIAHSQDLPPDFYPPCMNVGLPMPILLLLATLWVTLCLFASPLLLPIWTNMASLNPWLLSFHTVQFSDSSGCYLFLRFSCNSYLWLWEKVKHVCLRLHLDWKSAEIFFIIENIWSSFNSLAWGLLWHMPISLSGTTALHLVAPAQLIDFISNVISSGKSFLIFWS